MKKVNKVGNEYVTSYDVSYGVLADESVNLSDKQMRILKECILDYVDPKELLKHPNYYTTSYGYKHYFEDILGFYITNGALKEAMKQLGITNDWEDSRGRNVCYPIPARIVRTIITDSRNLSRKVV